jgi:hypothetical protein
LTIQSCGKLRALPRGPRKLGALKQLTLRWIDEVQEMPDHIGLTTLALGQLDDSILLQA